MKLGGKVAIVTGAGAGIGEATALLLAAEGARVCCNSLSASASRVAERIRAAGGEAFAVRADVSEEDGARQVVEEAVGRYGRLDILFNNAGVVLPGTLESTPPADWDRTMAVNVRSIFLVSRAAIGELKKTQGTIVNTSSAVAFKGVKDRLAYSASKGAVVSLTRAMAIEYIASRIRVNCVCPGTIDTPSLGDRLARLADPAEARKSFIARQPLGRFGRAQEIAEGVLFLVLSEFSAGVCLPIDGGMTA